MNWVNRILQEASDEVGKWPAWMQAPQVRCSESLQPARNNMTTPIQSRSYKPNNNQPQQIKLSDLLKSRKLSQDELQDEVEMLELQVRFYRKISVEFAGLIDDSVDLITAQEPEQLMSKLLGVVKKAKLHKNNDRRDV